ncbi:MAG: hypothetical protein V3575_02620 [Candidatus Absconditabacteria bacterium]
MIDLVKYEVFLYKDYDFDGEFNGYKLSLTLNEVRDIDNSYWNKNEGIITILPGIAYIDFFLEFKERFDNIKYNYKDYFEEFDGNYIPLYYLPEERSKFNYLDDKYYGYLIWDDGEHFAAEFYKDITIMFTYSEGFTGKVLKYKTLQIKEFIDLEYRVWNCRKIDRFKQLLIAEFESEKEKSSDPEKFQLQEDKILPIIERWENLMSENGGDEEIVANIFKQHLDSNNAKLI